MAMSTEMRTGAPASTSSASNATMLRPERQRPSTTGSMPRRAGSSHDVSDKRIDGEQCPPNCLVIAFQTMCLQPTAQFLKRVGNAEVKRLCHHGKREFGKVHGHGALLGAQQNNVNAVHCDGVEMAHRSSSLRWLSAAGRHGSAARRFQLAPCPTRMQLYGCVNRIDREEG
jgi:hypothetical protein